MIIQYPNYKSSILNVTNSVLKHFGVEPYHNTLPEFDRYLDQGFRNVVVMVLDGMGVYNMRRALDESSFFMSHLKAEISSVLPSTTTAATTTLQSGLSPAEHGWLGWSLYFPEVGDNVNIFPNTNSCGEKAADYNLARTFMPYKNVVDLLREQGMDAHSVSAYGTDPIESVEEMMERVLEICEQEGESYIYAYWAEPDHTMHETGVDSEETINWIKSLDEMVESLCGELSDTLLVVTADHGQVNIDSQLILAHPGLVETLEHMPSVEPRCTAFAVKEGMEKQFEEEFHRAYGEDFLLFSKEEVLEKKLFGPGTANPRFEGFIGDYLAVSVSPKTLFDTPEKCRLFVGSHAGMTRDEMTVPLIVATCGDM